MKYPTIIASLVLFLIVSSTDARAYAKRLANGYKVDPWATDIVVDLAKFYKGYNRLERSGSSCTVVMYRYIELDASDRHYQWVVKQADERGNRNGRAEYKELQNLFDLTCQNRGE
ncbi:MAG: hypothetical protein GY866_08050 [Proteobacteria bacterium]|nr:hypothetical protein [Pseudomonadota bacterium]